MPERVANGTETRVRMSSHCAKNPRLSCLARGIAGAVILLVLAAAADTADATSGGGVTAPVCADPGRWVDPASSLPLSSADLFARLAQRSTVLLGEEHDDPEHHRWQLHTIAALYGRKPDMVLGFEMFPRRVQPVLDRWVRGELSIQEFLERTGWAEVWGYDSALYLPLFHFARQNRIPMIALNVDRSLVSRVSREGWAAIPEAEREGLSDPAPPSEGYRRYLARVFAYKRRFGTEQARERGAFPELGPAERDRIFADPGFGRFAEAQITWDRAMAEALLAARSRGRSPLVVGIIGKGHLIHGFGVPRQLADLGVRDAAVLLPVMRDEACRGLAEDLAEAVFLLDGWSEPDTPRAFLGIAIEAGEGGVRVLRVQEGSVAQKTGLRAGDVIVEAAGVAVRKSRDLISIVRRQAPGTWLPLMVRRNGGTLELVARFPAVFENER